MKWFVGPIPSAIAKAKEEKKVFLVYIEGKDDMSKSMTENYNHSLVQNALENQVVAVRLQGDSEACQQFSQIYPVVVFPSSFFIGLSGIPLEVIAGCLEPAEFVVKVEKVIQIHQSAITRNQTNVSHSSAASSIEASSTTDHGQLQHETPSSQAETAVQNELFQPSCSTKLCSEEICSAPTPENEEPLSSEHSASQTPLEERVDRAKQLLAQKKEQILIEAEEKAKAEELDRRRTMKEMQKAREQQKDNELKEWAMSRAKDKEEERLVRERVKAQIAQDRADRAAKYQARNQQERESSQNAEAYQKAEKEKTAMDAAVRNQYARIQFRLADGSSVTHQFSADDTLEDVRNFVAQNLNTGLAAFSLCTTFPRRHFTRANYPQTLRSLQLSPSAVLLILPEQALTSMNRGSSGFTRYFWALLSPLVMLWGFIYSVFFGSRSLPSEGASNAGRPQTRNERQNDTDQQRDTARKEEPRNLRRPNSTQFYHQDGNIYRINNRTDDSDENNTWNGNSTQQM